MGRGNIRGRGANFGGAGYPRGGGGNVGGSLVTNHLRDLDIELQLLQRKRQIFEQEQNLLDRFASNTNKHVSDISDLYPSGGSNQYPGGSSNQYSGGSSDQYSGGGSNQYSGGGSNQYSGSNSNQYSSNSNNYPNNSNKRQYDNKQSFNSYNEQGTNEQFSLSTGSASYPRSTQPKPSNYKPQGVKRQGYPSVWQNQNPSPPKRFNAPQSVNPWQNPNDRRAEFRAVNQNPPQPKNFSAQTRSLVAQKPGIGQRIKNKYNPPPERKNFKPNKVAKPNQKPVTKAPVFRPSVETKKLIEETNKLIEHTNKIVGQTPKPRVQKPIQKEQNSSSKINTPPKSQNPARNPVLKQITKSLDPANILLPNRNPSVQVKGRLELALGMILKSVKELCLLMPDKGVLEYFNIPFIQRVIKHTVRVRIRNVMMNERIENVKYIVDKYREKYPQETDYELMKIAQDACEYNANQRRVLHLQEADNPEDFFRINMGKILYNKLQDVFTDLHKLYENKYSNIEELVKNLPEISKNKNKDVTQGNENGEKDTSGEIVKSGEKHIEEKVDTGGEKDTDGDNAKDGENEANGEKTTNDEKDTDSGKDKNGDKEADGEKVNTECSSEDPKTIVDQLFPQKQMSARSKNYVELVEKIIEMRLPFMLQKFKEEFMSILCLDKEFTSMKALVVLGLKQKFRESFETEDVIFIDDDEETGCSEKPATPVKPSNAINSIASGAVTAAKYKATTPAKSAAAAEKPAAPATTPAKSAAAVATSAATPAKSVATAATTPKSAETATKPAAASNTSVKPAAATTTPAKPAATAAKPAATTTPAKPVTATTAAEKSATPALATPAKAGEKTVPSTPKTPASKDMQYVKLIGRPALPARAVIYEFLQKFNPASIKKHKSINNLLVIAFTDKEGFEKILAANESVVGDATIIIKAQEQVNTSVQNKTPQQGNQIGQQASKTPAQNKESEQNKTNDQENKAQESEQNDKMPAQNQDSDLNKTNNQENKTQESEQDDKMPAQNKDSDLNKTNNQENEAQESEQNKIINQENEAQENAQIDEMPAQKDTNKDITEEKSTNAENIQDSSTDEIINSDLDLQISDLLTSIRKADEEEKVNSNEPKSEEKMDTTNIDDEEVGESTQKESDQNKETVGEINKADAKSTTGDSNTETIDLDTIMEVDDETKKPEDVEAKGVEEVAKAAKETGRATPTRSSSRLANVTPSTIKTRRASRLANNN